MLWPSPAEHLFTNLMKSKTKLPSPVVILILTLITTLFWVGFSAYNSFVSKPEAIVPEEISKEFEPVLNQSALEKIKERVFLEEEIKVEPTNPPTSTETEENPIPIPSPT